MASSPYPAASDGHQLSVAVATITSWCIALIILGVSPKWVAAASFPFPLHIACQWCVFISRKEFHRKKKKYNGRLVFIARGWLCTSNSTSETKIRNGGDRIATCFCASFETNWIADYRWSSNEVITCAWRNSHAVKWIHDMFMNIHNTLMHRPYSHQKNYSTHEVGFFPSWVPMHSRPKKERRVIE